MEVKGIVRLALEQLSMSEGSPMKDDEIIIYLHEFKDLVLKVKELEDDNKLLEERFQLLIHQHEHIRSMLDDAIDLQHGKIKIPHRCPICNGSTFDEEGALCLSCDGNGIVWG